MTYFTELTGDQAVLTENGVYKPAPLYTMDGNLFAKAGGGYVRLSKDGSTSKAKLRINKLITDTVLYSDKFGRLCVTGGEGKTLLEGPDLLRLPWSGATE